MTKRKSSPETQKLASAERLARSTRNSLVHAQHSNCATSARSTHRCQNVRDKLEKRYQSYADTQDARVLINIFFVLKFKLSIYTGNTNEIGIKRTSRTRASIGHQLCTQKTIDWNTRKEKPSLALH